MFRYDLSLKYVLDAMINLMIISLEVDVETNIFLNSIGSIHRLSGLRNVFAVIYN